MKEVPLSDNAVESQVSRRSLFIMALVVFAAAMVVYLPKIGNNFAFDDRVFIQEDVSLRSLSSAVEQFGTDQARLYRPLRSVVYAFLIRLFWLDSPLPFHLAGIFFHAVLASLVFVIVWLIFGNSRAALIAGLVFALHPVHADRVVNITGSFDLFGMMLGYAAWALALLYDRDGKAWQMTVAALSLAAGCLGSEEALMTLPLLAACFLVKSGNWRRRISLLATLGLVVVAYLTARTTVLSGMGRTAQYAAGNLGNSILTMAVIFWRYLSLLFVPFGLTPAYGPTIYLTPSFAPVIGLAGIVAMAALAIFLRRRQSAAALAIAWFFIGLLPFSNLLPGDTLMAERYLYSALGGFALLLGWVAAKIDNPKASFVAFAVILALYAHGTVQRCLVWDDPQTLWTQAAQLEPNSFLANLNAGYHSLKAGKFQQAKGFAEQAHRLDTDRAEPLLALGEIAVRNSESQQALAWFKLAVETDAEYCPAYTALAQGMVLVGDFGGAAQAAELALNCDESDPAAHYTAGYLFYLANRCDMALPHLEMVVRVYPPAQHRQAAENILQKCRKHM